MKLKIKSSWKFDDLHGVIKSVACGVSANKRAVTRRQSGLTGVGCREIYKSRIQINSTAAAAAAAAAVAAAGAAVAAAASAAAANQQKEAVLRNSTLIRIHKKKTKLSSALFGRERVTTNEKPQEVGIPTEFPRLVSI